MTFNIKDSISVYLPDCRVRMPILKLCHNALECVLIMCVHFTSAGQFQVLQKIRSILVDSILDVAPKEKVA